MPTSRNLTALLALLLATGCPPGAMDGGDAGQAQGEDGGLTGVDGGTDAGVPLSDGGETELCSANPLELMVLTYGPTLGDERYYVEVQLDGRRKAMQLDTGSGLTFLFTGAGTPDYSPDFAELDVGCETITVAGRGYDRDGSTVEGLEVVGLLGMDFLLDKPSELAVERRTLTRFDALPDDIVTAATPSIGFDDVQSHALVPATLDGMAVRLLFDTGGGDTLLVGVEGQPGDAVKYVEDFEGNVFPIYTGEGEIVFADLPTRTIPLGRAPEFPYFDATVAALGGNLHGLLGVSAFAGEALVFDGAQGRFWLVDSGQR